MSAQFEKCVEIINAKPAPGTPKISLDNRKKLTFYALFKQATDGDIPATAKQPKKTDMVNYYKHYAWTQCKGMSKDDAKKKYVELAMQAMPKELKAKL